MQYIRQLQDYKCDKDSAVTFGKFDGLHLGHQKLVENVQEISKKEGLCSVLCSFDMHPLWESRGVHPQVLMTSEERIRHLEKKIDCLAECPFTEEFSRIRAEDFIRGVVKDRFHARYVIVGPDFRFGYQKQGDVRMLERFAEICGYRLLVIEKERYQQRTISSTYIKEVLQKGDVMLAGRLLGYNYGICGMVERGKQLGRTLGFPTLNVSWPVGKIVPVRGVYLSRVWLEGHPYQGISNVGIRPTVSNENKVLIESFLFDYHGDAYGKTVSIELLDYRRPEQKFHNVFDLKECVNQDIEYGKAFFLREGKGEYK